MQPSQPQSLRLDRAIADIAPWMARVVVLGLVVYAALVAWSGGFQAVQSLRRIGVEWLVAGVAITCVGFALRTARWRMFLRALGPVPSWWRCAVIYMAGIGMTVSPGRAAEALRAAFLIPHGVPMGRGLTVTLMDRLSDVLAMLLLASVAAWVAWPERAVGPPWGWGLLLLCAILATTALYPLSLWVARSRWRDRVLGWPRLAWAADWLGQGAQAYRLAWRPARVLASVAVSLMAFGLQAWLFVALVHLFAPGLPASTLVLIFAASTLAGAASLLPGGLGVIEVGLVALLAREGLGLGDAAAVTLVLRAVTFWFALALGALALEQAARWAASGTAPIVTVRSRDSSLPP